MSVRGGALTFLLRTNSLVVEKHHSAAPPSELMNASSAGWSSHNLEGNGLQSNIHVKIYFDKIILKIEQSCSCKHRTFRMA